MLVEDMPISEILVIQVMPEDATINDNYDIDIQILNSPFPDLNLESLFYNSVNTNIDEL